MSSEYIIENETPIIFLDCQKAVTGLNNDEKKYMHSLNQASWAGSLICWIQTSPESPGLFLLFQNIFNKQTPEQFEKLASSLGFSDEEIKAVLIYIAAVYGNMGNYKSFGDSKFVPNIPQEKFNQLIESTEAFKSSELVKKVWECIKGSLFNLDNRVLHLGLGDDGITTYFSGNCNREDAEIIQKFLDDKNISAYNTRLFKDEVDGKIVYRVRIASSATSNTEDSGDKHSLDDGKKIVYVEKGDYAGIMAKMVEHLKQTRELALNDTEKKMWAHYIKSFSNGSIEEHKNASRSWIQDKGPVVENYIGFIESYRDPFGVRGEFESFVAVVNKDMSAKFSVLVDNAPAFLSKLPWGKDYEKDKFLQPDFTSLDIVTFANSGIPVGINIPNYDDIRQTEGFKNVSLGNVLASRFKDPKVNFLKAEDKEVYIKHIAEAFEIQVGLHELIGHGSGKLFHADSAGKLNFNKGTVVDLLNGGEIKSWYGPNETWDGKFTALASPYEECRAECVGVYLCNLSEVLTVFGFKDAVVGERVAYVNWLSMVRAGLGSLEMYTPNNRSWRQAHSQARFAILQVLLEAGQGLVNIEVLKDADDKSDLLIHLDASKIESVARPAIEEFLKKLQHYKSTGDFTAGSKMFLHYSQVNAEYLKLREIVMARKQPRPLIVQCNTIKDNDGAIVLKEYEPNPHGMINSYIERYREFGDELEDILFKLWEKDLHYFKI